MNPELSVIIPAYSATSLLPLQLDCLLAQETRYSFEVILADNGGNADLDEVVDRYSAVGLDVRSVRATDMLGAGHARDCGLRAAKSEFIAFCDADDAVLPTWVQALRTALDRSEIATGPICSTADVLFRTTPIALLFRNAVFDDTPVTFRGVPFAPGGNAGFRREALDGGCASDYVNCEDPAMTFRALQRGFTLEWAPDARVLWRQRPGQSIQWRRAMGSGVGWIQLDKEFGGSLWKRDENWHPYRQIAKAALDTPSRRVDARWDLLAGVGGALEGLVPGVYRGIMARRRYGGKLDRVTNLGR